VKELPAIHATKIVLGISLFAAVPLSGQDGLDSQTLAKARQGDPMAEAELGWRYHLGQGVTQDQAEAVRWLRKAADQGNAYAEDGLGNAYYLAQGVTKDYGQAFVWFHKAAEQGDAFAENYLGAYYDQGLAVPPDHAQAVNWWKKAADHDFPPAEDNLGLAYMRGEGVQQDYAQGVTWLQRAAKQGFADAESNLGGAYRHGQGVAQDDVQAADWYLKAADQGNAHAQNQLGWLYYHGLGVPQDYGEAAAWWRKAADQGNPTAQANLGDLYHLGQGVNQDDAQAAAWYAKAAIQGNTYSKDMLPIVVGQSKVVASTANGNQVRTALSPQAVAKLASESTVLIVSTDQTRRKTLLGSGFAVSANLVVTNSHVFPVGGTGFVRKIGSDLLPCTGKVVSRDKQNDIVLLYVPGLDLPALPILSVEPVIGDTVFAMGNPEGMEGTFSGGLVSSIRDLRGFHVIQITAPISQGSSGGPVLNVYGEVVGISTAGLPTGQNLNFAVPASAIDALLKRVVSK
jgi:TPR repeat protein